MKLEGSNQETHEASEGSDASHIVRIVRRNPKLPAFTEDKDEVDSYIQ